MGECSQPAGEPGAGVGDVSDESISNLAEGLGPKEGFRTGDSMRASRPVRLMFQPADPLRPNVVNAAKRNKNSNWSDMI